MKYAPFVLLAMIIMLAVASIANSLAIRKLSKSIRILTDRVYK